MNHIDRVCLASSLAAASLTAFLNILRDVSRLKDPNVSRESQSSLHTDLAGIKIVDLTGGQDSGALAPESHHQAEADKGRSGGECR